MRTALILTSFLIASCAGRPSFKRPVCESAYDDCIAACDGQCDPGPRMSRESDHPADQAMRDEPQADCARCVNACNEAAERCER